MDKINRGIHFIFSSYKRLAAFLIIGGLLLAVPITMSIVQNQQDIRQRASEITSEPLTSNSLIGDYKYIGTCTSGCTGDYEHTLKITAVGPAAQGNSGTFKGNGFYNAQPSVTWDITGDYNLDAKTMSYHLIYTGAGAGYTVDGTGVIGSDGVMEGTSLSSQNQKGTFMFAKLACTPLPACARPGANPVCALVDKPGGYCALPDSACISNSNCEPGYTCQTVGMTDSIPGAEIKQCKPSAGPTCTPLPACARPGANPICGLAEVPGGYCPLPTSTPTEVNAILPKGSYTLTGVCTKNCEGTIVHEFSVGSAGYDGGPWYFSGKGQLKDTPSVSWTIVGKIDRGSKMTWTLTYTGENAGYTSTGTGTYEPSREVWVGTQTTSQGQEATWTIAPNTGIACTPRPACFYENPACAMPEIYPVGGYCGDPCSDGVEKWQAEALCADGSNYSYGTYTCTDGKTGQVYGDSVCSSAQSLRDKAIKECINSPKQCSILLTPTQAPGGSVGLFLKLNGVGTGKTVKHPTRSADVQFYDSQGQEMTGLTVKQGKVNYNPTLGIYSGSVSPSLAPGSYTAKVRVSGSLWKQIPGIINIGTTGITSTPTITLDMGDANRDNIINILDYTAMISCMKDPKCSNYLQ